MAQNQQNSDRPTLSKINFLVMLAIRNFPNSEFPKVGQVNFKILVMDNQNLYFENKFKSKNELLWVGIELGTLRYDK